MTIRQWQRLGRKVILGGGLFLGWTGADALWAQGPAAAPMPAEQDSAPVRRNYMKQNVIDLPITMEDSARALIQEIHLYVKDQPNAPWVLRDKGTAAQRVFRFQAPRDGEFWFTMMTVDKQGRLFPPNLQNERPGLIVVIDTQKPAVEMINLGQAADGQLIQCDVQDANLDNARVRFYFQSGDKVFRPLEPMAGRGNVFCIPQQAVTTGVVRLVAEDLAGNQTLREEHLNHMATRKAPATAAQQASVQPPTIQTPPPPPLEAMQPNPLPHNVKTSPELEPADWRMSQRQPPRVEEPAKTVAYRPDGSEGPRFEVAHSEPPPALAPAVNNPRPPAPVPQPLPAKRQIVNNTKVLLDYQIDKAAANSTAKAEVWLTRDQGKTWHKAAEDARRKSPIEVNLPGEGLFGLILLVTNGTSASSGPAVGDTPDWWIEVDATRPVAQITKVAVTHDRGQACVQIQWTATDGNLSDAPVDLYYAATAQGPWLPIAKGLKASGAHHWMPPAEIGAHAHVRLIARDSAGNTCICNTLEAVHLESTPARINIRNVRTETPTTPLIVPPVKTQTPQPFQIIQTPPGN
jgi:hypothetical protein